jgi:hypothetical protein
MKRNIKNGQIWRDVDNETIHYVMFSPKNLNFPSNNEGYALTLSSKKWDFEKTPSDDLCTLLEEDVGFNGRLDEKMLAFIQTKLSLPE